MSPNNVAVITGGASGIGLAAAMRFAGLGMRVCIADLGTSRLAEAETRIASVAPRGAVSIMAMTADVSRIEDVSVLEQAVRERIDAGDLYILCPDNDVPRRLDERRILWAAGDLVENRPALSRWHPDYAEAFARFVKSS